MNIERGGRGINNEPVSIDTNEMMTVANVSNERPALRPYTIIKIQNVPNEFSSERIEKIFKLVAGKDITLPDPRILPQRVHVMMDVDSGKSFGIAFVEVTALTGEHGITRVLNRLERFLLQGCNLEFSLSNHDELCNNLFFWNWDDAFEDGLAKPNPTNIASTRNRDSQKRRREFELLIGQRELLNLLQVCEYPEKKYHLKRPQRPFEYLMSISSNIPWSQSTVASTVQRDTLYECYRDATDTLCSHLRQKQIKSLDTSLLDRLIHDALLCDGFTMNQKIKILNLSRRPCPEDFELELKELDLDTPAAAEQQQADDVYIKEEETEIQM